MRWIATLLVFAAGGLVSAATLEDPASAPVEGRSVTLTLEENGAPAAGLSVTAKYRENAHEVLQRVQQVGTTDEAGRVEWTPLLPGVVVLSWDGGGRNISVLHDGLQPGAILIGLFAGLALIGGSALFFLQMLRQESGTETIHDIERLGEPPST